MVVVGKALSVREVASVLSQGPVLPEHVGQENREGAGMAPQEELLVFQWLSEVRAVFILEE